MSTPNRSNRFPPSDEAMAACSETITAWRDAHNVRGNLQGAIFALASRVNCWIGPGSVMAGVGDMIGSHVKKSDLPAGALEELGNQLTRRLLADGILGRRVEPKAVVIKPQDLFGPGTKA